ncbi:hypothetical protein WJX79_007212 [Trebouxia sp. C0005]
MLCPFAERALLTLLFKGVPHQAVHVDRCEKPSWFVDLCKIEGLPDDVPNIELHGRVRASGKDSCRWICENFRGQGTTDLKYSNRQDKQQVDTLVQACLGFIKAGLNLLAGNDSRGLWQIGTGQTQAQWKAFEQELEAFQDAIKESGGPFLLGSEVSLADLIYMPFMERFAIAMPAFTPYDPCAACDGLMADWLWEMEQLECCQIAAPDHDLYLQAIRQWRSLEFYKHNTFEAFQLHPHLQ